MLLSSRSQQNRPSERLVRASSEVEASHPDRSSGVGVERRDVGLDVEDRGAVQDIHVIEMERRALDGDQPQNRETDRVGGAAGGRRVAKTPWGVVSRNGTTSSA